MLVPPHGAPAHGRDAIRAATEPIFALNPKAQIEVVSKAESDGLALTLAYWTLAGTEPAGGAVTLSGRGSILSRRQPDGTWRIVLDIPMRPPDECG